MADVVVGPDPYLASCKDCGKTWDMPDLPIELSAFARQLKRVARVHAGDCPGFTDRAVEGVGNG